MIDCLIIGDSIAVGAHAAACVKKQGLLNKLVLSRADLERAMDSFDLA